MVVVVVLYGYIQMYTIVCLFYSVRIKQFSPFFSKLPAARSCLLQKNLGHSNRNAMIYEMGWTEIVYPFSNFLELNKPASILKGSPD